MYIYAGISITIRLLCLDIRRRSRYTCAGASKIIIIEEIGKKSVIQICAGITRLPVYRDPVYRERTVYIYIFIETSKHLNTHVYTIDIVRKWTCAIECSVWHFAIEALQSKPTTKNLLHFKLILFFYKYILIITTNFNVLSIQ